MRILNFAELGSTSTLAAELVAAGEALPFAVVAAMQSDGRGSRGNAWESPRGNLYVTFALPPLASARDPAPLAAAVIVARTVFRLTGLTPTLKWPNDLLFGGKKLGGLLLEGSLRGEESGAVLCGLGLNLASAPDLSPPLAATSIVACTGSIVDPSVAAAALAAAFASDWGSAALSGAALRSAYAELAIAPGHLWVAHDDRSALRVGGGLAPDGSLELLPLDGRGAAERLHSVDHRYRWALQGTGRDEYPLVVADVGNTRTKIAVHRPASSVSGNSVEDSEAALAALAKSLPAQPWPIFTLSVNPARLEAFTRRAAAAGLVVRSLAKRSIRRRGDYPLSELGIDRLAACEGWLAQHREDAILVSCGTAITVDVVRADGMHRGGLIAPGLQTGLSALHASTGLLPQVELQLTPAPTALTLGGSTLEAMTQGVLHAAAGAVLAVATRHPGAKLVLTGGDAVRLAPLLSQDFAATVVPELALLGAKALALGGIVP